MNSLRRRRPAASRRAVRAPSETTNSVAPTSETALSHKGTPKIEAQPRKTEKAARIQKSMTGCALGRRCGEAAAAEVDGSCIELSGGRLRLESGRNVSGRNPTGPPVMTISRSAKGRRVRSSSFRASASFRLSNQCSFVGESPRRNREPSSFKTIPVCASQATTRYRDSFNAMGLRPPSVAPFSGGRKREPNAADTTVCLNARLGGPSETTQPL